MNNGLKLIIMLHCNTYKNIYICVYISNNIMIFLHMDHPTFYLCNSTKFEVP